MLACDRASWHAAVPDCTDVLAGPDVARSIAVLRGMTDEHGGTIAAATTSLPERDDSDRNYDYRFCWVRDTCYVGHAGAAITGAETMLDDAVRWVGDRLSSDKDRTLRRISVTASPSIPRQSWTFLVIQAAPTSIGNRVREQFQLDLFGEVASLVRASRLL